MASRRRFLLAATLLTLSVSVGLVSGALDAAISVPGTSNPYLAGMPNGSTCCGGDSAPAESPVLAATGLVPGTVLNFSVTGSVNFQPSPPPTDPPDGSSLVLTAANDGISSINAPANSLLGVFLTNDRPDLTAAPTGLDFSPAGLNTNFTTLSPGLKQVFFIGDGLTGNGTGSVQRFIVPPGANRLFLGTDDGFGWFNNAGAFSVTITATQPASVPTLGQWGLIGLGLALAAFGVWTLTRR